MSEVDALLMAVKREQRDPVEVATRLVTLSKEQPVAFETIDGHYLAFFHPHQGWKCYRLTRKGGLKDLTEWVIPQQVPQQVRLPDGTCGGCRVKFSWLTAVGQRASTHQLAPHLNREACNQCGTDWEQLTLKWMREGLNRDPTEAWIKSVRIA